MANKRYANKLNTRHAEQQMYATEIEDMRHKYITESAYKNFQEDFVDEDTGGVISIDRRELLFERGTYIDADMIARIRFSIAADELKGLHVSNQQRSAYEMDSVSMNVWVSKVEINAKNHKFIFYANNISNAIDIIRDYVEQKFDGGFNIIECKEFVSSIVLEDNLKEKEDQDLGVKKFFQIDTVVTFEDCETSQTFVVHTTSIEKAMIIIEYHINEREQECSDQNQYNGVKYLPREFKIGIEKAAPIPITTFIPVLFSEAYCSNN